VRLPLFQEPANYLAFERVLQLRPRRPDAARLLAAHAGAIGVTRRFASATARM